MREILFRGKRTDNGKWIEGSLVVAGDYCCILPADENSVHPTDYPYLDPETGTIDGHLLPVDPSTVGQYTSLTDKNGKKIFEGDIISVPGSKKPGLPGIVIFHQLDAKYILFRQRYSYLNLINVNEWGYVIGNATDNPELLEDKP